MECSGSVDASGLIAGKHSQMTLLSSACQQDGTDLASVHVVIVNWRSSALVLQCIGALAASEFGPFCLHHVTVVDNSAHENKISGNDVSHKMAAASELTASLPLTILAPLENVGFGAACNLAVRASTADYFLFLNPDIELRQDSIADLLSAAEAAGRHRLGAMGLRLSSRSGDHRPSCSRLPRFSDLLAQTIGLDRLTRGRIGGAFHSPREHAISGAVGQVIGACLLTPATAFRRVGGFDSRFFLYYEDVDLCQRLWQAGLPVLYSAEASAIHYGQGSTSQVVGWRTYLLARSRLRYCHQQFGPIAAFVLHLLMVSVEPLMRVVQALLTGRPQARRDVMDYLRLLFQPDSLGGESLRRPRLVAEGDREGPAPESV